MKCLKCDVQLEYVGRLTDEGMGTATGSEMMLGNPEPWEDINNVTHPRNIRYYMPYECPSCGVLLWIREKDKK